MYIERTAVAFLCVALVLFPALSEGRSYTGELSGPRRTAMAVLACASKDVVMAIHELRRDGRSEAAKDLFLDHAYLTGPNACGRLKLPLRLRQGLTSEEQERAAEWGFIQTPARMIHDGGEEKWIAPIFILYPFTRLEWLAPGAEGPARK